MLTHTQIHRPRAVRPQRLRTAQLGAALLEALVAILLLMLGILALIGLQGRMVSASTEAQMRGEATYLADQLIGRMSVDQGNLASYDNTDGSCGTYCTAWVANVTNTLPKGAATVTVTDVTTDSATVEVTVNWTPANSSKRTVQVATAIHF